MVYDSGKRYDGFNNDEPQWGDSNFEKEKQDYEDSIFGKKKPASNPVPAEGLSESTFDLIDRKKAELAQANVKVGPIPIGFPIPKFPWVTQDDLWKIHNLFVNGINPLTGKVIETPEEKEALSKLTGEQIAGLRKTKHADDLEFATDSFRNKRGCTCIQEAVGYGSAAKSLAVKALTGANEPTLIVDPFGHAARFDGMYPGNNPDNPKGAKKDYDRLKDKVYQVELTSPQNPTQEAKEQARLKGKVAQWEIDSMIAAQCGYEMRVSVTDTALVQRLNQGLGKAHPNFKIVEGHLGGTYAQVRANTVGGEVHHMPANDASPLTKAEGPAIWVQIPHHKDTDSNGKNGNDGKKYRDWQRQQILSGHPEKALTEDIKDIKRIAPKLYDVSIDQMIKKIHRDNILQKMKQKAKSLNK
jgi:hypothetical protein